MNSKKMTDVLLYASIALILFGSGYKYAEWKIKKDARGQSTYTVFNATNEAVTDKNGKNIDFNLFWDTWEKVEQKYIDKGKVDPEKMYFGAIKGMVASIDDPYTFFLTPDENKQSKDDLGGKFQGIGAQLGLKEDRIVVISPLRESPAEKAGLKINDIIDAVDGESTEKWTLLQ
nr:PDZ domain-containing protein [Candidatus Woesebacteria bacterium]